MKKKVIALIMIIPLVFLITLFSVGTVASILADIPVSGIRITTQTDEGFIYLDMAAYNSDPANFIYMEAQVEPSNAKNQSYSFKVESAEEGVEPADISIDGETGLLTLNGTGKAKVTAVSADNGFTDSVVLSVRSSKVVSLEPKLARDAGSEVSLDKTGKNEYSVTLVPDDYQFTALVYPTELSDSSVSWSSSDSNVISVNPVTGKATARLSGEATITLDCENAVEGFEPATIKVSVPYNGGESGITIEGHADNELMYAKGLNEISFLLELETPMSGLGATTFLGLSGDDSYLVLNEKYEPLDSEGKRYKVTLTLMDGHPENIELKLAVPGKSQKSTLILAFSDFKFNVYNSYHLTIDKDIYQKKDAKVQYVAVGEPSDDNVIYEWSASDAALCINVKDGGVSADIQSAHTGDFVLTVNAYEKIVNEGVIERGKLIDTITKSIHIVRGVYSIEFVDNAVNYGMENLLTLGDTVLDDAGYKLNYRPTLNLKVVYDDGTVGGYSLDDLEFSGENNAVIAPYATVDAFKVAINGDGVTTITAKWANGKYFNQEVKTTIKLRGVKGGVMIGAESDKSVMDVKDYRALKRASSEGRKVILMKNVMLGWQGMSAEELKAEAFTMPTDYDWTYYQNTTAKRPNVYYLIEFGNDVYGNGYTVNADYMAAATDSTGKPLLFKGPLDLVGLEGISVKAQDNICFLVRNEGVMINNVVLKGCSDESITDTASGSLDLTKLNYVGTTLEISADTTVLNSRISNGRTVVRIFGGETNDDGSPIVESFDAVNVEEERLVARIESCILTQAREFIVKIGSNRAVRAVETPNFTDWVIPQATNANGSKYNIYNNSNLNDEYFYDNYVITDVTIKNSVIAKSGLFSIGMETHFAGKMLASYYADSWDGCAATSFASVLHLEGDVKLYDWKDLSGVDSSTLIEISNDYYQRFKLQINEMLKMVNTTYIKDADGNPTGEIIYPNIIDGIDGKEYVHGGIALYGGGYNYSVLDMSECTSENFKKYQINLRILKEAEKNSDLWQQGNMLPAAAGDQDFCFYMYDKESYFDYNQQQAELSSGTAYILPIAPVSGNTTGG